MAVKQVIVSDISSDELTDETHARIIIDHPDHRGAVELDISTKEADKFQTTDLKIVNIAVHAPDQPVRNITIEATKLDKLLGGSAEDVLANARKVEKAAPRKRGGACSG